MKKVAFLVLFGVIFMSKASAQNIEIDTLELRSQLEEVQDKMMDMMGMLMDDSLFFFVDTTHIKKYEQLGEGMEQPSFKDMRKYMEQFTEFLFEDMDRFREQLEQSPLFKEEELEEDNETKKTRKAKRI